MKLKKIFTFLASAVTALCLTGCDEERFPTIIDGDLPIKTSALYMVGDATPNGWSMDNATAFTRDADDKYLFTWEGELKTGEMKACLVKDGTFSCPFLHPSSPDCEISSAGVAASDFLFYAGDPDNKWKVKEAGKYRITFHLKEYKISVEKK